MSLQFMIGNSGSGKSHFVFRKVIEEARKNTNTTYYVIVPEQFTLATQRTLVEMHPGKGILNIDILSFERLAYRVFEEVGGEKRKLLEETGKSMVLQKMVQKNQNDLMFLGSQMKKPGYLAEMKSMISEFMQYDVQENELEDMVEKAKDRPILQYKLKDMRILYSSFKEYLSGHYMTGEEVMDVLYRLLPSSKKLTGSVFVFDGFTGFTPVQMKVMQELLAMTQKVYVTVTMDTKEDMYRLGKPYQLFYMSHKMIHGLRNLTKEMDEPILIKPGENTRFANSPALDFLENHLFRYKGKIYEKEQEEIQIFSAANPEKELEEVARRMVRLVREKDYRYGEMAVITGDFAEYGKVAKQVFENSGIPYFLDEKHTILMNPFVEYVRAALEMAVQGFTYESVFRYLRCGISDLTREEIDLLENYCVALGIHGYKRWSEKWVRVYRGMKPEEIQKLNEIREKFVAETVLLYEGFSGGKKTVEEFTRCLYAFIVNGHVQEKLKRMEEEFKVSGEKAMEKEYAQVYGIVIELFDKMVEILGNESVSRQEYRQLLETGMSEAKVALIPPSIDQVLIGDMQRTRLKDIRVLFFVGVNEGSIPKKGTNGGMLNELDRDFFAEQGIELAPGLKEQMNMQRFYLYLNVTKPSDLLCLSYSQANGKGEIAGPAYLIGTIQKLFPKLAIVRADEPEDILEHLETPETSLDYFLESLAEEHQEEKIFQELYSWYLRDETYRPLVQRLVKASKMKKPADFISASAAKVLYGEVSLKTATRLEKYAACAFAHFLQYGLKVSERVEYEFGARDMGNIMHLALEQFAVEIQKRGLKWGELSEEMRNELVDLCLHKLTDDYGNTILHSSARNAYMIERTKRILRRTVWALQQQLKHSEFQPCGFEVSAGGGRIDRVDLLEKEDTVYVKIVDYKTGNTKFDLVALYHGLQMQLLIYLDAAIEVQKRRFPDKEIKPAGILYYNVKDPMLQEKVQIDVEEMTAKILKKLKMNGLLLDDVQVVQEMDRTLISLPASLNKDGSFSKRSSIASKEQFDVLGNYVKRKIGEIRDSIMSGDAKLAPYEWNARNACSFCPYKSACGFDLKLPGYEYRKLKVFSEKEVWENMEKEVSGNGSKVDE